MFTKSFHYHAALSALLLMLCHAAAAAEAWMIGWSVVDGDWKRSLISVNPLSGNQRVIGPLGVFSDTLWFFPLDLATNSVGELYLLGYYYDEGGEKLEHLSIYSLDTTTGAATNIGDLDVASGARRLAWDRKGRLWVASYMDEVSRLIEVDINSFQALRSFLLPGPVFGLTDWGDNILAVIKREDTPALIKVDPESGENVLIRELTESIGWNGAAWEYLKIWDIGFGPDGNLLLRADEPGVGNEGSRYLEILFLKGAGQRVDIPLNLLAHHKGYWSPSGYEPWFGPFAFPPSQPLPPEAIPSISPISLLVLSSLILLTALVGYRKLYFPR